MNSSCFRLVSVLWIAVFVVVEPGVGPIAAAAEAPSVAIARDGHAELAIVVGADASPRVRAAAKTLSEYLEKITGGSFAVVDGDGRSQLALGMPSDFPALASSLPGAAPLGDAADPTRREDYLLRSHQRGLLLLGASELAVEHAVWDLLYRLGHRQFFPSDAWEVVPRSPDVSLAVDSLERPSYYARRIWFGFGGGSWGQTAYQQWCAKNRATSGIELSSGHAYDGMLKRNKAEFQKHPEYLGLVGGERKSTKFCISNAGLRQLIVDDALRQFAEKPEAHSLSVDPSDGGGWCQCEACQALGGPSNRAVTLANAVAEAVEQKHPGKFIGMYAYNEHSPPPTIRVHPRVVISVATAFIRGGYTVDQLMAGWQKQGATVGVREYYGVHTWTRDLPGKARGANIAYLREAIPRHHELGARFLSAESTDNWGCNGLGYYLAARMLWNVGESRRIDELKADFLDLAFGPARPAMRRFYQLIDADSRPLLTDDLLGRMYLELREARRTAGDPQIVARVDDLIRYTRYLELWSDYENARGVDRQRNFETLARFAYRMRRSLMVHTVALVRDVPARDKSVFVTKNVQPSTPESKNPWISDEPFADQELIDWIELGIERRKLLDFQPIAYSDRLVPASPLRLPDVPTGSIGIYNRGVRNFHTWIETAPSTLRLQAAGGLIYGNLGEASLSLFPAAEAEGKSVAQAKIAPDKQTRDVELTSGLAGLHRLELSDRTAGTSIVWPDGAPMTIRVGADAGERFYGRWTLYFYVPRGVATIGGFADGDGTLQSPDGKTAYKFNGKAEYFSVPTPPGQDGKLWKFDRCSGVRHLMTVPPYVARSARELLLPAEVVERDR